MPTRSTCILLTLLLVGISACTLQTPVPIPAAATQPESTQPEPTVGSESAPAKNKKCGNLVCEPPENETNCPADCAVPGAGNPPATQAPSTQGPSANEPAVLYIGTMIHLEGWNDQNNKDRFDRHAAVVRDYATLFEKYGAKLTLESKELTDGSLKWGDNVLLEMQGRGHGIGVHADIGGELTYDCSRFVADLQTERVQLESLGVTVKHVSGNTSHCDWVTATADAGYLFTTGQVAYSVMSMPEELRPAEYRNCPSPSDCHDTFPTDLADRIHPWRMNTGADWLTNDPNGRLVMLPSGDDIPARAETIDQSIARLEQAIALSEPGRINVYYFGKSIGQPIELSIVETWLQKIQPYVDSSQVKWMTLPEMYDAYAAWEGGQ